MMIDFDAIIRHFWPKALHQIQSWGGDAGDQKGLRALANKSLQTRQADLREWLRSYAVFQGFTNAQRDQITEAVVIWADARNPGRDLATADTLATAHAELQAACQIRILNGPESKNRDLTSLASKALWLCYPDSVPIYDAYARNALQVISKMEDGITSISEKRPKYEQFVHIWKLLYERNRVTIENLEIGSYPYRVRVFDAVLWLLGQPSYRTD